MNPGDREIRVMVVDDSPAVRTMLVEFLESDGIRVVAQCCNGQEALARVAALAPDLVTMDLEMPVMGGLEAIEQIMARYPVPILAITAASGAGTAFAAVTRGAMDLIPKPDLSGKGREQLIQKVRQLAGANMGAFLAFRGMKPPAITQHAPGAFPGQGGTVLAIAASTGGPQALQAILSRLDPSFPAPVVIAQHVGEGFCRGLAEWLGGSTPLEVKEAAPGEALASGRVYLNPPDSAMRISVHGSVILAERDGKNWYRPCCDTLLQSVAEVYVRRSIGLILSGMGDDGVRGMLAIRKAGGATLAQNAATSVVYGMNGAAVEAGAVEWTLPLDEIPARLQRLALEARQAT
jgi:two-component system chemotaxis response regulator CheB